MRMVENLHEKALIAYEAIFNNKVLIEVEGRFYNISYTSVQNLRKFNIEGYNYLEQNPEKSSGWAKLAKEGHQIMWVMKGRSYLAQVFDGVFNDFRKVKK
ncbi:hypothetical protein FJY84_06070 [Candidatus Bathyarchaeota archaeon]|nr:hypothetical protein [Candidatus Bathyarchaeota archaeon]